LGRIVFGGFDKAMVAYLKCMKELADFVEEKDKSFQLPYR